VASRPAVHRASTRREALMLTFDRVTKVFDDRVVLR
jgi:hypothetical protein